MKKVCIFVLFVSVLCCFCIAFMNSDRHLAKKLSKGISEFDNEMVCNLIEENPRIINCFPTFFPKAIRSMLDIYIQYPLAVAAKCGNEQAISLLIAAGANINSMDDIFGDTPIICALNSELPNRFNIAEILLEEGADITIARVNNGDYDALITCLISMYRNNCEFKEDGLDLLYAMFKRLPKDYDYSKVLRESISLGCVEALRLIVDNEQFDINQMIDYGFTPLSWAVLQNEKDIVLLLLQNNADVSCRDEWGKTAYDYALEKGFSELADLVKPGL